VQTVAIYIYCLHSGGPARQIRETSTFAMAFLAATYNVNMSGFNTYYCHNTRGKELCFIICINIRSYICTELYIDARKIWQHL